MGTRLSKKWAVMVERGQYSAMNSIKRAHRFSTDNLLCLAALLLDVGAFDKDTGLVI